MLGDVAKQLHLEVVRLHEIGHEGVEAFGNSLVFGFHLTCAVDGVFEVAFKRGAEIVAALLYTFKEWCFVQLFIGHFLNEHCPLVCHKV